MAMGEHGGVRCFAAFRAGVGDVSGKNRGSNTDMGDGTIQKALSHMIEAECG